MCSCNGTRLAARMTTHVTQPASGSVSRIEAHTASASWLLLSFTGICVLTACHMKMRVVRYQKVWGIMGSAC